MMTIKQKARAGYKKFAFVEGNQHIASEFALFTILKLIDKFKIKSVLEIGLGIGCIADTVLANNAENIYYVGSEANDYCLSVLEQNLGENFNKITLKSEVSDVNDEDRFQLCVLDGNDYSLEELKKFCANHAIIYVEGDRSAQISKLKKIFPKYKSVFMASDYKNPTYGPFSSDHWAGGGTVIFVSPTPKQSSFVLREKIRSKINIRRRRRSKLKST